MIVSPNPYRNKSAIAAEHNDILLAACTQPEFLQSFFSWLVEKELNRDKRIQDRLFGQMEDGQIAPRESITHPWSTETQYQQSVTPISEKQNKEIEEKTTVDAIVSARRYISDADNNKRTSDNEQIIILAQLNLPSVTELQRRINLIREYAWPRIIIITRRTGIAIQPLIADNHIVINPAEDTVSVDELPVKWKMHYQAETVNLNLHHETGMMFTKNDQDHPILPMTPDELARLIKAEEELNELLRTKHPGTN